MSEENQAPEKPDPLAIKDEYTAAEVQQILAISGVDRIKIRDCSMCGYPLSYIVQGESVMFDPGCDCITRHSGLEPRTFQDIANHYNMQTSAEYKDHLNKVFRAEAA